MLVVGTSGDVLVVLQFPVQPSLISTMTFPNLQVWAFVISKSEDELLQILSDCNKGVKGCVGRSRCEDVGTLSICRSKSLSVKSSDCNKVDRCFFGGQCTFPVSSLSSDLKKNGSFIKNMILYFH